eukprot:gene37647-65995_t
MWDTIDASGVGVGPRHNRNPLRSLYFVTFRESALLTMKQRNWARVQRIVGRCKLRYRPKEPTVSWTGLGIRTKCFRLTQDPRFDPAIMAVILVNCAFLASMHWRQSEEHTHALYWAGIAFTCIFAVEAIMKWAALGGNGYFRDKWNRFDFLC